MGKFVIFSGIFFFNGYEVKEQNGKQVKVPTWSVDQITVFDTRLTAERTLKELSGKGPHMTIVLAYISVLPVE